MWKEHLRQTTRSLPLDKTLLIYPTAEPEHFDALSEPLTVSQAEHVILLDGTWQQARKIYNRTEYLKRFSTTQSLTIELSNVAANSMVVCVLLKLPSLLHEKGLTKQAESQYCISPSTTYS
ncbi:DTW domain-containing protein [Marinomonas gallaica]|uniref:DTW domain-containing protein n=1 Tax=Marinomonas gallaica TaxID=1806667 RepID=UPI003A93A36D